MLPEELKSALTPVLGRIPSGVFILVAGGPEGRRTGLLASWIQQASFEPPQVTVAVNKARYLKDWLQPGAAVTLNQVVKGDSSLFKQFGKGFEPDADAFAGVEFEPGLCGLPRLKAALSTMEGQVVSSMEAGDHIIFLVTLTHAMLHKDPAESEPYVHIRKNGFSY